MANHFRSTERQGSDGDGMGLVPPSEHIVSNVPDIEPVEGDVDEQAPASEDAPEAVHVVTASDPADSTSAQQRPYTSVFASLAGNDDAPVAPRTGTPTISFKNVSLVYPAQPNKPALDGVSLDIYPGEFVFVVGHSGSGKSSLLRLITCERRATSGQVLVAGQDLTKLKNKKVPYLRRQIGTVYQDFKLLPDKTVYEGDKVATKVEGVEYVGYKNGKPVAEDMVMDYAKPESPKMSLLAQGDSHREAVSIKGEANQNYIYRINCGGDDYTDEYGQLWHQDNKAVSHSWDDRFDNLQPYLGSQRTISAPVRGTKDMKLMQTFRFGREQLYYEFNVGADAATNYRIELYMIEPWIGRGESYTADKEGLRLFDVAVNDSVKLRNIDLWAERGFAGLCKFVVYSRAKDGKLRISFPRVAVGEAVISAIAISADSSVGNIESTKLEADKNFSWPDADKQVYEKMPENLLLYNQCIEGESLRVFCRKFYLVVSGVDERACCGVYNLPLGRRVGQQHILLKEYNALGINHAHMSLCRLDVMIHVLEPECIFLSQSG